MTGMIEWSQKSRPKKIPRGFQQNPKKSLDQKLPPPKKILYSQNYAARALTILFNTPKKSLLKSSYPKNHLPNFRTQKNPRIENFKPKKILLSSPSLDIPSTPPPSPGRKPYRIGLLFTHKNGDLGALSVTERSCAAPISKVESHISERCHTFV